MEILSHQSEGSFIVRKSTSNPGSFALSLKGPQDKIAHYLIEKHAGGFRLQVWCCMLNGVLVGLSKK